MGGGENMTMNEKEEGETVEARGMFHSFNELLMNYVYISAHSQVIFHLL